MEANMVTGAPGTEPEWVLSLPAQRDGGHPPPIPVIEPKPANHVVGVISINAGEGIGEKIQSYFQNRENFPSELKDHDECWGTILSAKGTVSSPTLEILGSAVQYEGSYEIMHLSNIYSIPKDGPVQPFGSLKICLTNSDGDVFGGNVTGSLVAASTFQVVVLLVVRHEEE